MNRLTSVTVLLAVAVGIAIAGCSNTDHATARTGEAPIATTLSATSDAGELALPSTTTASDAPMETLPPPSSVPEPEPIVAGIDLVELLAPEVVVTDVAPEFVWAPLDGASAYRLVVLAGTDPVWAWEGDATTVRLGAVTEDAGAAFPVPELSTDTTWSVAALDADGNVLAVSDQRPVSRS